MNCVITPDKTRLQVKDWGTGTGTPAILIHGWPLSADSWDGQDIFDQAGGTLSQLAGRDDFPVGQFFV